jgi:plasmid stabilization system protein ParE
MKLYSISLDERAEQDFIQAKVWLENEKIGLGDEFSDEVAKAKIRLSKYPKTAQIIHKTIRRLVLNKFKYSLFFTINENTQNVVITAIIHHKRNPNIWKNR